MIQAEEFLDYSLVIGIRSEGRIGKMAKNLGITVQFSIVLHGPEMNVFYFMPFSDYQSRDYRILADAANAKKIDDFYIFQDEADVNEFRGIRNILALDGVAFTSGELNVSAKYVRFCFPHVILEKVSDAVLQLLQENDAYSLEFLGSTKSYSGAYPFRTNRDDLSEIMFRLGRSDHSGKSVKIELKILGDKNSLRGILPDSRKVSEIPIKSTLLGDLLEMFADYPLCTNGIFLLLRSDHLHISIRCQELYLRSLERAIRKFTFEKEIPLSIDEIK
ncbi:MAG: hypothetical protein M1454_01975 [Candidatus Thermoplasmatota archaeon]|nr:hypothetical protein [Candidatus Thermoplasmatota archaeon]MCL5731565.1 hypothetical protein [Candidatus Thermoplasmatota archaeon]